MQGHVVKFHEFNIRYDGGVRWWIQPMHNECLFYQKLDKPITTFNFCLHFLQNITDFIADVWAYISAMFGILYAV